MAADRDLRTLTATAVHSPVRLLLTLPEVRTGLGAFKLQSNCGAGCCAQLRTSRDLDCRRPQFMCSANHSIPSCVIVSSRPLSPCLPYFRSDVLCSPVVLQDQLTSVTLRAATLALAPHRRDGFTTGLHGQGLCLAGTGYGTSQASFGGGHAPAPS